MVWDLRPAAVSPASSPAPSLSGWGWPAGLGWFLMGDSRAAHPQDAPLMCQAGARHTAFPERRASLPPFHRWGNQGPATPCDLPSKPWGWKFHPEGRPGPHHTVTLTTLLAPPVSATISKSKSGSWSARWGQRQVTPWPASAGTSCPSQMWFHVATGSRTSHHFSGFRSRDSKSSDPKC